MRNYNYYMGLRVGNTQIPDVSKWAYQVGDLDTSGSRDATGLLHRKRVATKINYEFSWNSLVFSISFFKSVLRNATASVLDISK